MEMYVLLQNHVGTCCQQDVRSTGKTWQNNLMKALHSVNGGKTHITRRGSWNWMKQGNHLQWERTSNLWGRVMLPRKAIKLGKSIRIGFYKSWRKLSVTIELIWSGLNEKRSAHSRTKLNQRESDNHDFQKWTVDMKYHRHQRKGDKSGGKDKNVKEKNEKAFYHNITSTTPWCRKCRLCGINERQRCKCTNH